MKHVTSQTTWHGQRAWVLESEVLRVVIAPLQGGKLVSLFDKYTGTEWLVGPGRRPFRQVPYGASFVDQDMSGWDEMFPTIVTCDYPAPDRNFGTPLPDHGEIWSLPWAYEQSEPGTLRFSVKGVALGYRLTRTLSFSDRDMLLMQYELQNFEQAPMPYLWAAHPQFVCGNKAQIILPVEVIQVCNSLPKEWEWGEPESRFSWPEATGIDGKHLRIDLVGPPSRGRARKFFVPPEKSVGWAGLVLQPSGEWLLLEWDPDEIPYLGLWIDEGKFNHETVVALEPMTGYYDSLAIAWEKQRVAIIEPGEIKSWTLSVSSGRGGRPFPGVEDFV